LNFKIRMKASGLKPDQSVPTQNTETLKSSFKSTGFTVKHALMHIANVTKILEEAEVNIEEFKKQKQYCHIILKELSAEGSNINEEVLNALKAVFEQIYSNLTIKITQQKQENEKLQQKIVNLKKEKTDLQQLIIACGRKCAELEQELGKYPK